MVFYRKYRPQLISELDLESVRSKLTSILSSNNIPHAFLFAGPKGLGKTSGARILAKAINCEQRLASGKKLLAPSLKKASSQQPDASSLNVEPCNKCSACISITNGSAVDVLEIDAASNRGIDEIRDLRERIKFSPAHLKTKIYIIDEVHMLTTEAFNALLKTLEEPPSHVIFILATTETGKLPETITSRTFLVSFNKPKSEELARSLKRVADGEELEIEKGVLEKVTELSGGAFRDAAKILEDLSLAANNKKITLELLESLYKSGSTQIEVDKLIEKTFKKNAKDALEIISNLESVNADFKIIIEKMADKLHAKLLESVSKNNTTEVSSTKKLLELLDEAYKNLRGAVLPQLPLEMAVIEFCLEQNSVSSSKYQVVSIKKEKEEIVANTSRTSRPVASSQKPGADSNTLKNLIDSVNQDNKILAGLLRGCILENSNGSTILKAPSSFHVGKLGEQKNREVIERILGKPVAIEVKS